MKKRGRKLGSKAAFKCEYALEKRCRCRCDGKLHERNLSSDQLARLKKTDVHYNANFYCPGCPCVLHRSPQRWLPLKQLKLGKKRAAA